MVQNLNSTVALEPTESLKARIKDPDTAGSVVVTIGSITSKIFNSLEHVDFLISAQNQQFRTLFEFWNNIGWWAISLFGFAWLAHRLLDKRANIHAGPTWPLAASIAFAAFITGATVTISSNNALPRVITSWGSPCNAVIDTSNLKTFQDNYKIGLICIIPDPTRDPLTDDRVLVSGLFEISRASVTISAPPTPSFIQEVLSATGTPPNSVPINGQFQLNSPLNESYVAFIVPKDITVDKIKSLNDVRALNGKLLDPLYYK
jgi:hypothetical protein